MGRTILVIALIVGSASHIYTLFQAFNSLLMIPNRQSPACYAIMTPRSTLSTVDAGLAFDLCYGMFSKKLS